MNIKHGQHQLWPTANPTTQPDRPSQLMTRISAVSGKPITAAIMLLLITLLVYYSVNYTLFSINQNIAKIVDLLCTAVTGILIKKSMH